MAEDPGARTQSYIARQLRVSQPTVYAWLNKLSRPESHRRAALELLTGGRAKAAAWTTAREAQLEARLLRAVQPVATVAHDG